ncbi:hypothetical protein [Streptomyces cupreus]|uniref:Uncharacterized protein n=1 Tax=Streptomyces cupreus TaxID=2759956 RepID=A0A7X1JAA2_9ACTN|nr:hypothetical protein [Streptomyces cupreus]MBC2907053.1 hypothetical protein [Streptomyces cupreus]
MDTTEQLRARRHLQPSREAAMRFGDSLDVVDTAQELADVLVPALGDLAGVELAQAVFDGDDPLRVPYTLMYWSPPMMRGTAARWAPGP